MIGADAAALLTCAAFSGLSWHLKPAISIFSPGWLLLFSVIRFIDEVSSTAAKLSPLLIFYVTVICFFVYCLYRSLLPRDSTKAAECFENSTKRYDANHALKPLLFPARTTHTRFFPQKHSFSYSYLLVGVPVGWRGVVRSYLSVDLPVISSASWQGFRRSWFSVNAEDYLVRGGEHLGLQGKLHSYLESQVGRFFIKVLSCAEYTMYRARSLMTTPTPILLLRHDSLATHSTLSLSGICTVTTRT